MKCPLTLDEVYFPTSDTQEHGRDCLKEECAWWDRLGNQCNEVSKAHELMLIRLLLKDIRDNMPHEGQVRL